MHMLVLDVFSVFSYGKYGVLFYGMQPTDTDMHWNFQNWLFFRQQHTKQWYYIQTYPYDLLRDIWNRKESNIYLIVSTRL